jgi:hypothetical protein
MIEKKTINHVKSILKVEFELGYYFKKWLLTCSPLVITLVQYCNEGRTFGMVIKLIKVLLFYVISKRKQLAHP